SYDLVIRGGTVVDGSGLGSYRADVGVRGDRIVAVGRIRERGEVEVDADGHAVTPGFIDGHTHMDAQVLWDELGTSSCWHGEPTDDDIKAMATELEDALRAGAYGFTTSRTEHHRTSDDRPVASRLASWNEVVELVSVLGELGTGIFQLVQDPPPADDPRRDDR